VIGFVSSPTAYTVFKKIQNIDRRVYVFEYDKRFGMHGREYISSETGLYLAQFSCRTMYGEQPTAVKAKYSGAALGTAPDIAKTVTATVQTTISEPVPTLYAVPADDTMKVLDLSSVEQKTQQIEAPLRPLEVSFLSEDVVTLPVSTETHPEVTAHDVQTLMEVALSTKMDKARLTQILKTTEIAFIPVLNIDGRKKVETGDSCTNQRKNGRNVDINRNFADWFSPNNARPSEEDYQGPSAMSEWESNIVKVLATQFRPNAFIDVHSGDMGMGYVFGHSGSERSSHDGVNQKWVSAVDSEVFQGKVWHGNLANMGTMPYESHGSSCDYMYQSQGAHISGTWEVWRKTSFFVNADASMTYSGSLRLKEDRMTDAASKFDHVDTTVVSIPSIEKKDFPTTLIQSALMPDVPPPTSVKSEPMNDLQSLLQSSLDSDGNNEALGLTRSDMQELIQSMQAEGKPAGEIQSLLQDMGREQCFAYFNPIMPADYDSTVAGFSLAILVGAEKLSAPEIAQAI